MKQDRSALRRQNYRIKRSKGLCIIEGCQEKSEGCQEKSEGTRCVQHKLRHSDISAKSKGSQHDHS